VLSLRPFDFSDRRDLERMAKWANDPAVRHFSRLSANEAEYLKVTTPEEIASWNPVASAQADFSKAKQSWMLLLDGEPVGEGSVAMDPPQALTKEPQTAWMGILIGEARARDQGLGARFFALLEQEARALGALRAELGVFEFNTRAIRMYERLGYRRIAESPDFTWWNGRKWADYRYLKEFAAI
jgi:RimJ/RimL family protein N-acetyltransferase